MGFKFYVPFKRHVWEELEAVFLTNWRPPGGLVSLRISAFLADYSFLILMQSVTAGDEYSSQK